MVFYRRVSFWKLFLEAVLDRAGPTKDRCLAKNQLLRSDMNIRIRCSHIYASLVLYGIQVFRYETIVYWSKLDGGDLLYLLF